VESVGFYTQETDQDDLTFFSGWIGSRKLAENIWREMLINKQYLIVPKKRDNLFAGVTTFLPERDEPKRGVFDTRLLSIKG